MDTSQTSSITFLFADPGDSLLLWEQHPAAMQAASPHFRAALQQSITAQGGEVFNISNDTLQAAFHNAPDAVSAALQAQRTLLAGAWELPLRPRLALLTGSSQRQGNEFLGPAPHRAAKLLSVAHGGQILLCHITADLAGGSLPEDISLADLGEHRLPDLTHPERLFQLIAPGLPDDFPPLKSLNNQPTNLPTQPNTLVGRQDELLTLARLLRSTEARLVTLTGIGGTGKTRLGLQAAADLLAAFPDGVFFVPLDQLTDPGLVASTIAQALSLELSGSQSVEEAIQAYLRSRHILLVLDNFEHLLAAASLVSTLLAACPKLKVLVTSREALHLRGEHEFPLEPLPLPDMHQPQTPDQLAQFASVALFIQRAQAVRPDFKVDNASAPAVAEICAFLDGLPLAIELAAARVRLFSPQALLARLKSQPALSMLSGGARDLPARQQTLQNTLEWSYDLLNPAEQALFRRLGVFDGGFTLEAADEVCYPLDEPAGEALELLTSLLEKSLVRRSEDGTEQPRFSLLFILRQFALEILEHTDELPIYRAAHAAYFLSLAGQAKPVLEVGDPTRWLVILEGEHDNFRAALNWSISNRSLETAFGLVAGIWRFWWIHGHLSEGRRWAEQVLSLTQRDQVPGKLVANVHTGAAALAKFQGDFGSAREHFEQSLEIHRKSGDRLAMAGSMGNLGYLMIQQGEIQSGTQLLEESIVVQREFGDKAGLSNSLNGLAFLAMDEGDFPRAVKLLDESLALRRDLGDPGGTAAAFNNLGLVELYRKNYDQASQYFEQSLKIHQDLGDLQNSSLALTNLGLVLYLKGSHTAARSNFEQALKAHQEIGSKPGIAETLEGLAGVASAKGSAEKAATILGATEALREAIGAPLPPADLPVYQNVVKEISSQMKKGDMDKAWSAGRQMLIEGLDQVITYALEPDEVAGRVSGKATPAGLTARESDVLRLLAQGLADSQIAEKLFISPRTVNAHLTSIYGKLGVNSRAAATRFAIENRLT